MWVNMVWANMIILKTTLTVGLISMVSSREINTEWTVTLHLHVPEENTCSWPEIINATLHRSGIFQDLHLQKISDKQEYIPVLMNYGGDGNEGEYVTDFNFKDTQLYTDKRRRSAIELSCNLNPKPHFVAKGVLSVSDGKIFRIETDPLFSDSKADQQIHMLYSLRMVPTLKVRDAMSIGTENVSPRKKIPKHGLQKRDTSAVYIDVLVLVGYSVFERWLKRSNENTTMARVTDAKEQIKRHFALLFNSINLRFKTASPDYNIKLVGLIIEDRAESEWLPATQVMRDNDTYVYGEQMLRSVWNWTSNATDLPAHDVTIAYETMHIQSETDGKGYFGLSYGSSICNVDTKPVAVVSYQDLISLDMRNTASELAHALGSLIDGPPNNCSSSDNYLMSDNRTSSLTTNTYYFSPCSRSYMDSYIGNLLRTSNSSRSCLTEAVEAVNITDIMETLPGEVYTPDEQCRHYYGLDSFYCHHKNDPFHKEMCLRMYCYFPGSNVCYSRVAADGTTCGNKSWCDSGECNQSTEAPTADPECVHMDQASIGLFEESQSCQEYVADRRFGCYFSAYFVSCCQSCIKARGDDEVCLYGDNLRSVGNCSFDQCLSNYNDTTYISSCCETCQNVSLTTPGAISSTVTSKTMSQSRTSAETTTVDANTNTTLSIAMPQSGTSAGTTTSESVTHAKLSSTMPQSNTSAGNTQQATFSEITDSTDAGTTNTLSTKKLIQTTLTTSKISTSKELLLSPENADKTGLAVGLGVGLSFLAIIILLVVLYCTVIKKNIVRPVATDPKT